MTFSWPCFESRLNFYIPPSSPTPLPEGTYIDTVSRNDRSLSDFWSSQTRIRPHVTQLLSETANSSPYGKLGFALSHHCSPQQHCETAHLILPSLCCNNKVFIQHLPPRPHSPYHDDRIEEQGSVRNWVYLPLKLGNPDKFMKVPPQGP